MHERVQDIGVAEFVARWYGSKVPYKLDLLFPSNIQREEFIYLSRKSKSCVVRKVRCSLVYSTAFGASFSLFKTLLGPAFASTLLCMIRESEH